MAYTDHEIGRVIQAVEDMGKFDNTLIIYIGGDNGASPEGTTLGTPNEFATFNSVVIPVAEQLKYYDSWGSDETFPHYAVGWAWAFGTPFKWTKQVASHFGGTRQGMAMSWPTHITDAGGIRHQFHHVIDIMPRSSTQPGYNLPDTVNGIPQKPIDGVSMVYTWDKANATAPSVRKTQYFEMLAMRGLYHEGWMASTTPPFVPWAAFEGLPQKAPKDILNGYTWELYNLADDPTQADDIAAKYPEKLAEMQKIFMTEAAKYNVLPLDNRTLPRFLEPRPSATAGRSLFTYSSELANVPKGGAPSIIDRSYTITAEVEMPQGGAEGMLVTDGGRFGAFWSRAQARRPAVPCSPIPASSRTFRRAVHRALIDRSYTITAEVEMPQGGAEGMLVTDGGRFGGYGLYILKGKPVFVYNFVNLERFRWEAKDALSPGKHKIVFDFKYDGLGFGHGGSGTLRVDGKVVDKKEIPRTLPFLFPVDETFDVGVDTRTPIDDRDYQVPFRFQGKLVKLTVEMHPMKGTLAEIIEFKLKTLD